MCTFLSTLPKKSKTVGNDKKRNLVLSLRPCPDTDGEKTWYRFRLLNFSAKNSDRDYPFITRYVHQKWKTNDKGFPEIENEIVCPVTKWTSWDGDRYDCPICKFANQQYSALKESNWKDADARKKNKEFGRKFQAIIPVYVVNDPNYEGNNGKIRVIIFSDKKFYDEFVKKIEKQLLKANCFNGVNAVDCCIHMSIKEEIINEGQPNQWVWKQRVIDQIAFSKPYDLPAITKESVDAFPFDETFYVGSTNDEIQTFYKKYIKVSNDDIVVDDDDSEMTVYDSPKVETVIKKTNTVNTTIAENTKIQDSSELTDDDIDDLTKDPDEEGLDVPDETPSPIASSKPASKNDDVNDDDVEDLLAGLDL